MRKIEKLEKEFNKKFQNMYFCGRNHYVNYYREDNWRPFRYFVVFKATHHPHKCFYNQTEAIEYLEEKLSETA